MVTLFLVAIIMLIYLTASLSFEIHSRRLDFPMFKNEYTKMAIIDGMCFPVRLLPLIYEFWRITR